MARNSAWSETTRQSGLGLVAIWLIALYFATIATALLAFSGLQFQMALGTDGNTSIGQLQLLHAAYRQRDETIRQTSERLLRLRTERNEVLDQIAAKESLLSQLYAKHAAQLDTAGRMLVEVTRDRTLLIELRSDPEPDWGLVVEELAALKSRSPTPAERDVEQIDQLLTEYDANGEQLYVVNAELDSLRQRLEASDRAINDQEQALGARRAEEAPEPLFIGLFQQLQFFESLPGGLALATMPPSLLIPIVTLAMGALGSVLHLSIEVVEARKPRGFLWYIFRPMLGMVTAFAVFIVIQAGALVVTTPTGSAADATQINAYFIAFVAVLSGMLSEQAVGTLREAGTKLLGDHQDAAATESTGTTSAGAPAPEPTAGAEAPPRPG